MSQDMGDTQRVPRGPRGLPLPTYLVPGAGQGVSPWDAGRSRLEHRLRESRRPLSQDGDSLLTSGVHVEPDICHGGCLANIHRTLEVRANQRSDRIAVATAGASSARAIERDIIGKLHVLAPRALRSRAGRCIGLSQDDADGRAIDRDNDVGAASHPAVPPSEVVEFLPVDLVEIARQGHVADFFARGVDEGRADGLLIKREHGISPIG
jgi:hypothetical protein